MISLLSSFELSTKFTNNINDFSLTPWLLPLSISRPFHKKSHQLIMAWKREEIRAHPSLFYSEFKNPDGPLNIRIRMLRNLLSKVNLNSFMKNTDLHCYLVQVIVSCEMHSSITLQSVKRNTHNWTFSINLFHIKASSHRSNIYIFLCYL